MAARCPGSDGTRTPTLETRKCPVCGGEVEVFSTDVFVGCNGCGWESGNSFQSCFAWCKSAEKCRADMEKEKTNQ